MVFPLICKSMRAVYRLYLIFVADVERKVYVFCLRVDRSECAAIYRDGARICQFEGCERRTVCEYILAEEVCFGQCNFSKSVAI